MSKTEDAFREFIDGNHKFSAAIYKEVLKNNHEDNFLICPFSAEVILALVNEGATGETSLELVSSIHLPNINENTRKALKYFLPNLNRSDNYLKIFSANRIYTGKNVKLQNDFKDIAENIYESGMTIHETFSTSIVTPYLGIDNVDFEKREKAAATINKWVENNTSRKIKSLINPNAIEKDFKMVLVNTLYFCGKWQSKFKPYKTMKRQFFKSNEDTVAIDTMHRVGDFRYYEDVTLKAKFLELSYEASDIKMVIVLPNEIEGLFHLEENFEQLLAPQHFTEKLVSLNLPKFVTESTIKVLPALQNLGIKKIFTPFAELSGISTSKELYVSDIIQKTFIEVNEEGTEAAAATEVGNVPRRRSVYSEEPLVFHVDHPFAYFIKLDNVILFTGRVTNP